MKLLLLSLTPFCLFAQSGPERPSLGKIIDHHRVLHPVSGIAGSFLLDEGEVEGVVAATCSQNMCAAKLENSILLGDTTFSAPHGAAVMSVQGTQTPFYFPATRQFARVRDKSLEPFELVVNGAVIALRASTGEMAVRREDGIRIISHDGSVIDFLAADATTVLLLPDALVYATAAELVLRHSDGSEQHFQAVGIRDPFAISDEWVEARSPKAVFALRTNASRESLYILPESDEPRGHR
jgi:hypothetical protein